MGTIDSERVIKALDNQISRLNALKRKKKEERAILKREIETLEEERWKYEDLRTEMLENANE